jgi:ribosomal protein L37AE/L43A
MPQSKRPVKKARGKTNKCPWCGGRKFTRAEKLNILEKIRYIGCDVWICGKCGKKWAG